MKRRYRLSSKARFRQVRQEGTSYAHPLVVLCCLANQGPVSRVGFTVSRRIGNAVARNRTRRRISEAVRLLWDLVVPGWDMVWVARPGISQAEFTELQDACARLLRRAHLLGDTGRGTGERGEGQSLPAASAAAPQVNSEETASRFDPVL